MKLLGIFAFALISISAIFGAGTAISMDKIPVPPIWCHDFSTQMGIGAPPSSEMHALRETLSLEGFPVDEQGAFDEEVASAVSGFQERYFSEVLQPYGLEYPTGYVGIGTLDKLNSLYGCTLQNKPPVIDSVSGPVSLKIGEQGEWGIAAHDPDSNILTYGASWGDGDSLKGGAANAGHAASFTHSYSKAGDYTVLFTVSDDSGNFATSKMTVHVLSAPQKNRTLTVKVLDGSATCTAMKNATTKKCVIPPFKGAKVVVYDANWNYIASMDPTNAKGVTKYKLPEGKYNLVASYSGYSEQYFGADVKGATAVSETLYLAELSE
jgi:hypothetical protein